MAPENPPVGRHRRIACGRRLTKLIASRTMFRHRNRAISHNPRAACQKQISLPLAFDGGGGLDGHTTLPAGPTAPAGEVEKSIALKKPYRNWGRSFPSVMGSMRRFCTLNIRELRESSILIMSTISQVWMPCAMRI